MDRSKILHHTTFLDLLEGPERLIQLSETYSTMLKRNGDTETLIRDITNIVKVIHLIDKITIASEKQTDNNPTPAEYDFMGEQIKANCECIDHQFKLVHKKINHIKNRQIVTKKPCHVCVTKKRVCVKMLGSS